MVARLLGCALASAHVSVRFSACLSNASLRLTHPQQAQQQAQSEEEGDVMERVFNTEEEEYLHSLFCEIDTNGDGRCAWLVGQQGRQGAGGHACPAPSISAKTCLQAAAAAAAGSCFAV